MKWVDADTDNNELSTSTASNTTLPHLEATNAERALDDNERRRRKEARKLKREAREKEEEQRLEDKKQRKEERRLKQEARRKRREARKKKIRQQVHHQAYQVVPKMEMMMSHTKCRRGTRRRRKERARATITNMSPYPLTILLFL